MEFTTHLCCALAAVSALCAPAEAAPMALRVDLKQIQESPNNEIGYSTAAEAIAALRSRPDVQISQQGGWTIVIDPRESLW
jgi:hypothetical protein